MEENKSTKISLSTFFLIIAIIVIIIMGFFIYKLNNDKLEEVKKSTNLQFQVNSLNETVGDLQGKINTISETINSNSSSISANKTNSSVSSTSNDTIINNKESASQINTGTFSVKNITDKELDEGVIGWINILDDNKFEIPRTWWNE